MYSMTTLQAALLGCAVLVATAVMVLGALVLFPRTVRVIRVRVSCPLLRRQVMAEVARDEWTLRFTDVVRCSVLGGLASATCNKGCLALRVDEEHHLGTAA